MKKTNEDYILNKVEGFNPYDHVEDALGRDGQPVLKKNGEKLQYLSTEAKIFWFRCVHPEGSLRVFPVPMENNDSGISIRYRAEVRFSIADAIPVAEWQHQESVWDLGDFDIAVARVQTIALGKALSKAGFGCEIESKLGIASEGENPDDKPKAKTEPVKPKKRSNKKEVKEDLETSEALDEVEALMSKVSDEISADKASKEASIEAEKNEEAEALKKKIEAAYKFKIQCTEDAPAPIRTLEGLTIEEAINERPKFISFVSTKPNVRDALTEETVQAVDLIAANL